MNHLHYHMAPSETTLALAEGEAIAQVGGSATGACDQLGENHQVVIENNHLSPALTTAQRCDTLTFITKDAVREINFGVHEKHESYAGYESISINPQRNKTITLNQTGSYWFHEHDKPEITGFFLVAK